MFLLDKPIWNTKVSSKVKSFVFTKVLSWINTNDMLQVCWPHMVLSSDMSVICKSNSIPLSYLFLHCPAMRYMWNNIFGNCGESWMFLLPWNSFFSFHSMGLAIRSERKLYCNVRLWDFVVCLVVEHCTHL